MSAPDATMIESLIPTAPLLLSAVSYDRAERASPGAAAIACQQAIAA